MKIEWLAHDKARHGFTLRDRLVAELPRYAATASRMAGLLNLRNRHAWLARAGERLLGFSARRSLPHWRRDTFFAQPPPLATREEVMAAHARHGKGVVLFVDTFNATFESENARDAAAVLQAAGYVVHAARGTGSRPLCCGRTYLSTGMVDRARAEAQRTLQHVLPLAKHGLPIVGLEPSCLLTLRDEMLGMHLGEAALAVSQQALLLEEFLAREARAGRFVPVLRALDQPLLVHGHCHQKAFGAMAPVMEVLRLIPGAAPEVVESSCCGMAGSFGYEAAHHDVSMQMAELSLLPAVRSRPGALVVADGTSCRHQIRDGAQREALHVARILRRALKTE